MAGLPHQVHKLHKHSHFSFAHDVSLVLGRVSGMWRGWWNICWMNEFECSLVEEIKCIHNYNHLAELLTKQENRFQSVMRIYGRLSPQFYWGITDIQLCISFKVYSRMTSYIYVLWSDQHNKLTSIHLYSYNFFPFVLRTFRGRLVSEEALLLSSHLYLSFSTYQIEKVFGTMLQILVGESPRPALLPHYMPAANLKSQRFSFFQKFSWTLRLSY